MTHEREALARTIVGILGNVISFGLFIAPVPIMKRICQKKTTEAFHPYPYLACVMTCLLGILYGLPVVHPDSTLIITINSIGLFLELLYIIIFFFYTSKKKREIILLFLFGEGVLIGTISIFTILCFHTHHKRTMFVGIVCIIFGIIMYGSPLSIIKKVVKTKSVEYLPFWLCLAGFLNAVVWFTYANLKIFDPYLASGNGGGVLLGLVQLSVYAYYSLRGKNPLVQDDGNPGDVQLHNPATNKDIAPLPV